MNKTNIPPVVKDVRDLAFALMDGNYKFPISFDNALKIIEVANQITQREILEAQLKKQNEIIDFAVNTFTFLKDEFLKEKNKQDFDFEKDLENFTRSATGSEAMTIIFINKGSRCPITVRSTDICSDVFKSAFFIHFPEAELIKFNDFRYSVCGETKEFNFNKTVEENGITDNEIIHIIKK